MADQLTGVEVGTGYVSILPDARGFHDKLRQQVEGGSGESGRRAGDQFAAGFGRALPIVGGAVAGMFAADRIKQFASESITAASDLAESGSKVNVVFGDGAAAIQKWAETSSTSVLLSKQAALEAAGTYGNLFTAMGISQVRASELSRQAVQMAADLASFNNRDVGDVLEKIRSGLVGETEPLRDLGINLNQARIQQEALNAHLWDGKGRIDAAAQAQAAFNLIMKDGANAVGDVDRTASGFANTTRAVQAAVDNAKASIGQGLVLAVQDASKAFGGPKGLTDNIEGAGVSLGNFVLGAEIGLNRVLSLTNQLTNSLPGWAGGGGAMNWVDSAPGTAAGGITINALIGGYNDLVWAGDQYAKSMEKQQFWTKAWAQDQEDITMQHRAAAAATYAATQAANDYGRSMRSVSDDVVHTETGIRTLQDALDEFDARAKARQAGTGVRDAWRQWGSMGETEQVKKQVPNPKWTPGSSVPQFITKSVSERQAFDPDVVGGRFAFTASGDAGRAWATGLGQKVQARAAQFDNPADAEAFIERWTDKLGKKFADLDIKRPYAYAQSFMPDAQPYAIAAAMQMHQRDREPMQQSGGDVFNMYGDINTGPDADLVERLKQDAHQVRGSRIPHGAARADR